MSTQNLFCRVPMSGKCHEFTDLTAREVDRLLLENNAGRIGRVRGWAEAPDGSAICPECLKTCAELHESRTVTMVAAKSPTRRHAPVAVSACPACRGGAWCPVHG